MKGVWTTLSLVLTITVLGACSKPEPPPPSVRPAVIQTVSDRAEASLQAYSGEVRARHEADLAFRVGGKLIERNFNLGDRVKKGQTLARIDPQDARLSASASEAQVTAAEADVAYAKAEYDRARSLYAQKFISSSALDTRQTQLEAAQAKLKQARAQAGVTSNQLGYTTLVADRDGVITLANAEAGQVVAAGQSVARLADTSETEVLTWVPESRVSTLKVGQDAFVRPWNARDKTLSGKVREIAAAADTATRTYAIRVSVADPDKIMPLGSTAAVAFNRDARSAVALPLPAVLGKGADAHVWIVDQSNAVRARAVKVSEYRDEQAVIEAGLSRGERVVIVGAHQLSAGMKVQPVDASAPAALDVKR